LEKEKEKKSILGHRLLWKYEIELNDNVEIMLPLSEPLISVGKKFQLINNKLKSDPNKNLGLAI